MSFERIFETVLKNYLDVKPNYLSLNSNILDLLDELSRFIDISEGRINDFKDISPALDYIDSHLYDKISVEELSKMCFMSRSFFSKRFREYTGGDFHDAGTGSGKYYGWFTGKKSAACSRSIESNERLF